MFRAFQSLYPKSSPIAIVRQLAAKVEAETEVTAEPAAAKTPAPKETSEKTDKKKEGDEKKKKVFPDPVPRDNVYGIHPVKICLSERKRKIYKLFSTKSLENTENEALKDIYQHVQALKIPTKRISYDLMDKMTRDGLSQGVALKVSRLKPPQWSDCMESYGKSDSDNKVFVYLDQIIDPMNMGAVIRTCVFMGVDGIFIPKDNSCNLTPTVSKASSGALECGNIIRVDEPLKFFAFIKRLNWDILGTDVDCTPFEEFKLTSKNRLIVLGNEGHGINEDIVHFFTNTLSIPGAKNRRIGNLNVSVTSGVLLSHLTKNKRVM